MSESNLSTLQYRAGECDVCHQSRTLRITPQGTFICLKCRHPELYEEDEPNQSDR